MESMCSSRAFIPDGSQKPCGQPRGVTIIIIFYMYGSAFKIRVYYLNMWGFGWIDSGWTLTLGFRFQGLGLRIPEPQKHIKQWLLWHVQGLYQPLLLSRDKFHVNVAN